MILKLLRAFPIRYFFLAFNIIQWAIATVACFRYMNTSQDISASVIFALLGTVLYAVFTLGSDHIRHVTFREDQIIVMDDAQHLHFNWSDIQSIKVIPIVSLYKLRVKGKKGSVYFFPAKNDAVFTLISKESETYKEAKVEYLVSAPSRKAS